MRLVRVFPEHRQELTSKSFLPRRHHAHCESTSAASQLLEFTEEATAEMNWPASLLLRVFLSSRTCESYGHPAPSGVSGLGVIFNTSQTDNRHQLCTALTENWRKIGADIPSGLLDSGISVQNIGIAN